MKSYHKYKSSGYNMQLRNILEKNDNKKVEIKPFHYP